MIYSAEKRETEKWRVREYRESDKGSLLSLSAMHYGSKEQGKEEYIDWLYSGTPAGRTILVVVEALPSEEIIGFLWHLPFQANFQGRSDRCYLGCNGLMHPNYRRKGTYAAAYNLAHEILEDNLFILGFPKPAAVGPLRNVGHMIVCHIPLLLRPFDINRLTAARFANSGLRLAMNLIWPVAGATIWRPQRSLGRRLGIQIFEEASFDDSFDDFWERVAEKYEIIVARDRAFLNWRFCDISFRSYRILSARVGGELVGYLVLRCTDVEGVPTGLIMDFLVEPSARGEEGGLLLIEDATRRFRDSGMAMGSCLMLRHTQEYNLLRRAGYIECPERFAPQAFRLSVRSMSPYVSDDFVAQSKHWFVSMANHDAV